MRSDPTYESEEMETNLESMFDHVNEMGNTDMPRDFLASLTHSNKLMFVHKSGCSIWIYHQYIAINFTTCTWLTHLHKFLNRFSTSMASQERTIYIF